MAKKNEPDLNIIRPLHVPKKGINPLLLKGYQTKLVAVKSIFRFSGDWLIRTLEKLGFIKFQRVIVFSGNFC